MIILFERLQWFIVVLNDFSTQHKSLQKIEIAFYKAMSKQHRNLFIQIHQPEQNYSHSSLINNWTLPLPMEFHIINSPQLNSKLAHLVPQSSPKKVKQIPLKHSSHGKKAKRHKYERFQQELIFLQQFLLEFKDLKASEVLEYRQKLLVRYLWELVQEIKVQCKEKGTFLQSIWNAFVRIFQQVFERVIVDSKQKEKKSLESQINLHELYQSQLDILHKANQNIKREEVKTSSVISQLAKNIAILNIKLKKSNSSVKQLTYKYEELRSQHIQLLVVSSEMTRAQAQLKLRNQQQLLFSKAADSQTVINAKPKTKRRARVYNNNLDVQLLLQQIQAESDYQSSVEQKKKQVQQKIFVNQKVQTIQIKKETTEQQAQWQSPYQILQTGIQTGSILKQQNSLEIQTDTVNNIPKNQKQIVACFNIIIKPQFSYQQQKLSTHSNQQNISPIVDSTNIEPVVSKDIKDVSILKSRMSVISKARVSAKMPQKQMFRIADGSRASKRSSNLYRQKILKTQGSTDNQNMMPIVKRESSQSRVSDLILIQELRQDYIKKYSRFRKTSMKRLSLSENFCQTFVDQSNNLDYFQKFQESKQIQNIHFSKVYSNLIENIREMMKNEKRKKILPNKCMKQIGSIFKMATRLINEGVFCLDLVSLTTQFLSALQGKQLARQQKQKKFIQFIISCIPLAVNSYLVKSFLLLCGFPFGKMYHVKGTRNEKQRDQEKLDKQYSKDVFSSEVYAYFKLLIMANCQQNEDMLQAYTNEQTFRDSLKILPTLYRGSSKLIQQINQSVVQSIQHSQEKKPKLDIFKSLHLVLDKILAEKSRLIQSIEPLVLLIKEPDSSFGTQIISLLTTNTNTRSVCQQVMKSMYCSNYTTHTLATMALIQGLQLETYRFAIVEQDHKFTILKRLILVESHKQKLIEAMVKAIPRKELRKQQFLVLLKILWNQQAEKVIDHILGKDLKILNNIGTSITLTIPPKDNYHSLVFDGILQ